VGCRKQQFPPALLPLTGTARSGEEKFGFGGGEGGPGVLIGDAVVPTKRSR
jgi:hypothetical protein